MGGRVDGWMGRAIANLLSLRRRQMSEVVGDGGTLGEKEKATHAVVREE
jgi:hypothetical protein